MQPTYKLNLIIKSKFCFKTADHKTAQLIQKMSDDLQVYCRNKPLLQSTPFIGKVNFKVQLYVWMKFYIPLFQPHSSSDITMPRNTEQEKLNLGYNNYILGLTFLEP